MITRESAVTGRMGDPPVGKREVAEARFCISRTAFERTASPLALV